MKKVVVYFISFVYLFQISIFENKIFGQNIIAFESMRGNEGIEYFEICLINSDGTDEQILTNNIFYDGMPSISPDGNKIAFISTRDGNYELYVMNTDGSDLCRLTENSVYEFSPKWSPDGAKIAFCSYISGNADIYTINADGSNLIRLTSENADNDGPDWSPNGNQIVFSSTRNGGGKEIFVMNSDGTNQVQITNLGHDNYQADWSPDGQKIAFMTDKYSSGNGYEIATINIDGTNIMRLTNNFYHDEMPEWSPDGEKIAFFSGVFGSEGIFIMNVDGSNPQKITNNMGRDYPHDWREISTDNISQNSNSLAELLFFQIFPNPCDSQATISFELKKSTKISIEIYDILGNKVADLGNNEKYPQGKNEISFDVSNLQSGTYNCILTTDGGAKFSNKIIVTKQ